MEPIKIKVNQNTIEKMFKYYDSQMVSNDDPSVLLEANSIGCHVVLNSDNIATFTGENQYREAAHWSKKISSMINSDSSNFEYFPYHHIGTAETGSTDYIGPICFVSCYVTEEDVEFLKSLQIEDVNELTSQEIIKYAKQIKDRLIYSLLVLDNSHYNKMVNDGLNLQSIKAKLSNQSTVNIMQKVKQNVEVKAINQFVAPKTYFNYLKNEVIVVKDMKFDKDASKIYMAVLASEILSKYAFLSYFANMSKSLKVKLVRSTGTEPIKLVAKIASHYGENILNKVVKLNFSDTKKVKAILEKEKNAK